MSTLGVRLWVIFYFICGNFCHPQIFYDHQNIMKDGEV